MLIIGNKAPEIELLNYENQIVSLKDFKGKQAILYFYPKDNTSGCTLEAKQFTDFKKEFEKLNAVVIGISKDSVKSHCNFRDKHDLQVMLLSDTEQKTCNDYGIIQEKSMYGRKYMGIVRTTFLIDEAGTIKNIWNKVKANGHALEVLEYLNS
jgi:thioredoxin-dependent peroxiredoxin